MGHLSQRANLLGYALLVNSLTRYLAIRREPEDTNVPSAASPAA